jgi:glycosyltransferase involved in cell wall biosynthesis
VSELLDHAEQDLAPAPARATLPGVVVLLATFQGSLYLKAQLNSLAAQSVGQPRLLWRDDGSTDATPAIMEQFARAHPHLVQRVAAQSGRLGVALSYHALALHAAPSQCVAFCDQDDVWLPHKLARALAALGAVPQDRPALYCARQTLVDAQLRPLGQSLKLPRDPGFAMALAGNIATGCTVVLNPAAAALFRAAPPPPGALHDWWSYLLVTGAGGAVLTDDEPVMLYRQHARNTIGAPQSRWRRAVAALRRGPGVFMAVFRTHVAELAARDALLTPQAAAMAEDLRMALQGGMRPRVAALRRHRLRRQTRLETALFILWFLIG